MSTFFCILTVVGEAKLANATALGQTLEFSQMALGDGGGNMPTPNQSQESLVNEVRRKPLNTVSVDEDNPNWIVCEQIIPANEGGWTIRELGIIDVDGDLVAVGNFPETYKPVLAEGSGRTQTVRMVLQVSNSASVTLKIDPSIVLATREYVDSKAFDARRYTDSKASLTLTDAQKHSENTASASLSDAKKYTDTKSSSALSDAKKHADSKAASALTDSKKYTDNKAASTLTDSKKYTDSKAASVLSDAKKHADSKSSSALSDAKTHADSKANTALNQAKSYAKAHSENAFTQSKQYTDQQMNNAGVPVATVLWLATNVTPNGFLKANGAPVSRSSYSALFAKLGTTFGAGNGSSTFNIPDLRGEFIRGWDDQRGVDPGRAIGSFQSDQANSIDQVRTTTGGNQRTTRTVPDDGNWSGDTATGRSTPYTVAVSMRKKGVETRPRNVALVPFIKY